mmetsp:Transcript_50101/g.57518  ORF Transcript_50101/g.57518 Transcript_50101/m.57518 type:complete len:211 (-) Transcript_50101:550-1182(-)
MQGFGYSNQYAETINRMGDCHQIELFISCRSLKDVDTFSKSDPRARIHLQNGNSRWVTLGDTETIENNLNPNFSTTFRIDYLFEVNQAIRIEIFDVDKDKLNFIGEGVLTVATIMGSRQQCALSDIRNPKAQNKVTGKLIVRAEEVSISRDVLTMQFYGLKLENKEGWFSKSDPFLNFYRKAEDGSWLKTHTTEVGLCASEIKNAACSSI